MSSEASDHALAEIGEKIDEALDRARRWRIGVMGAHFLDQDALLVLRSP